MRRRHARPARALACLLAVALATGAAAATAPPRVVADIAPVHALVARVMAGVGTPRLLIPAAVSPHHHALRPSEARALAEAELVVRIGGGLTPFLARALPTLAPKARSLDLLAVEGVALRSLRGADGRATAPVRVDPHAWLDPENAGAWVAAIAEALAEVDPERAARYAANAAVARAELSRLAQRVRERLAGVSDRPFLVFHDAFQYFEARFGLVSAARVASGEAVRPGPRRISELRQMMGEAGIVCVFAEVQHGRALIETLVEGTDARISVLDPLGARHAPGPELYPALLESLAEDMAACLSPALP